MTLSLIFTMTACLRPELLEVTLSSLFDKCVDLRKGQYDFRINVDVTPKTKNADKQVFDILAIADSFFRCVEKRVSNEPNYTRAVKWVWRDVKQDLVFHLEDDWKFVNEFRLEDIVDLFENDAKLQQINISHKPITKKGVRKIRDFRDWNRMKARRLHYGLGAYVYRSRVCRVSSKRMKDSKNPEHQMRNNAKKWGLPVVNRRSVKFFPDKDGLKSYGNNPWIAEDIGQQWLIDKGLLKNDPGPKFISWENNV